MIHPPAHPRLLSLERLARFHKESRSTDVATNSRSWIMPLASKATYAAVFGPQSFTTNVIWLRWPALSLASQSKQLMDHNLEEPWSKR